MSQLTQTYTIKAPADRVWQALTDPLLMAQWSGDQVQMEASVGGQFSLWGGDIHGVNTVVVPNQRLEQDWYGHDHPQEKYRASFSLKTVGEHTLVHLDFSGHIYDRAKDLKDWREYYFEPIKKLLEN